MMSFPDTYGDRWWFPLVYVPLVTLLVVISFVLLPIAYLMIVIGEKLGWEKG